MSTTDYFNKLSVGHLPGYLGISITHLGPLELRAELPVRMELMAPNGFLHAGSIVTLADTCSGYGCVAKATQVWDAVVTHKESGRTLALFRCTQMVLYAKQGA